MDQHLQAHAEAANPGTTLTSLLATRLPRALAAAVAGDDADTDVAHLSRDARRRTAHRLAALPLQVTATAGYAKAEVTAGGVALDDLDRRTLESRLAPGTHWCGEVCDVTASSPAAVPPRRCDQPRWTTGHSVGGTNSPSSVHCRSRASSNRSELPSKSQRCCNPQSPSPR